MEGERRAEEGGEGGREGERGERIRGSQQFMMGSDKPPIPGLLRFQAY